MRRIIALITATLIAAGTLAATTSTADAKEKERFSQISQHREKE